MHSVVIARYKESLEWILDIPGEFAVYIYNKGPGITDPSVIARATRIVDRKNIGRESETYIHHMLSTVQANHSFTVFTQGDPFDHSPDFLELLSNWRTWNEIQPLSWRWQEGKAVPPALVLAECEAQLKGRPRVRLERFSLATWSPLDFYDEGALTTSRHYRAIHGGLPEGTNIASHFLKLCDLPELAEQAHSHALGVFCYGAIFALRNDLILKFPTAALQYIYPATTAAAVYGYILERLWLHLFGAKFELEKAPAIHALQSGYSTASPIIHTMLNDR